jgi:pimeloyl-ACP methyl ester carboxylesterase
MKQAFAKHLADFKQIYLDMPGFGQSPNEDSILTTQDYANIIELFLQNIGSNPTAIAGHSFGGKVATLLKPQNLILLSSAGVLVPKPFKIRAKIAIFKALKPFGIAKLRKLFVADDAKSMNSAMYETFKNVVDEEFEHNFANFNNKAILFWGISDTATPLWTAQKINKLIKNSKLYELEGDHFFFLNHGKFIAQTLTKEI